MFVVGLTGGIGSGKSTAALLFAQLGVAVVDTDQIAHQLTAGGGAAMDAIQQAFGAEALTAMGALDRARMRQRAFAEPATRERLEQILHPMIRAQARQEIAAAAGISPYAILVVPLLVERAGWNDLIQRIAVVDCSEAQQIERVLARSTLTPEDVKAIMAAQAARAVRLAAADDVIENHGDLHLLKQQVEILHQKYLELAAKSPRFALRSSLD